MQRCSRFPSLFVCVDMIGFQKRLRITVVIAQLVVVAMICAFAVGILPDTRAGKQDEREQFVQRVGFNWLEPKLQNTELNAETQAAEIRGLLDQISLLDPEITNVDLRRLSEQEAAPENLSASESGLVAVLTDSQQKQWVLSVSYARPSILELMFHPMLLQLLMTTGLISVLILIALPCLLPMANAKDSVPEHVRAALDSLTEGVLVIDEKQRIVLVNKAFGVMFQTSSDHFIGSRINEIPWFDENGKWPVNKPFPWEMVRETQQAKSDVLMKLRMTKDQMLSFSVNCSPVVTDKMTTDGVLISFDDITQLEANKEQLRVSRDEAQAANRAKSQFLANMSHEIRTPINAILGFTDVLKRGFDVDMQHRQQYLKTIYTSAEHLLSLINDILDLSKIESGRYELEKIHCSPLQILHDVVDVLRVKAVEKELKLSFDFEGSIPEHILSDPTRIRQVLTNLIANAIKFTETGGVHVSMRLQADGEQEPRLHFDVIDTGVGLSEEAQRTIFHAFMQADTSVTRKYGGTGLGLTISRNLASSLGGALTVESEQGKGSTFHFSIATGPISQTSLLDHEQATEALKSMKSALKRNSHFIFPAANILVVDDAEANRELMQLILERQGLHVFLASNGKEAIEICNQHTIDVIFMDMQMPVMDGYTATRQLRKTGWNKPIVALTANAFSGDEEKCINAGCSRFVTKPISMDELLTVLADTLGARVIEGEDLSRKHSSQRRRASGESDQPIPSIQRPAGQQKQDVSEIDPFPELSRMLKDGTSDELMQSVFSKVNSTVFDPAADMAENDPEKLMEEAGFVSAKSKLKKRKKRSRESTLDSELESSQTSKTVTSTLPMSDPAFRRIVVGFVADMQTRVMEMQQACQSAEWERLAELAHWLKGAGGTVGFQEFSALAKQLEQTAKLGQEEESGRLITEIVETYQAIDLGEPASPVVSS